MASKEYKQTKELPIYSAVWKLVSLNDDVMTNMQRDHKHTLGLHMLNRTLELLLLLSIAFNKVDLRLVTLQEFIDVLNEIESLFKLCCEKRYIELKYYIQAIPLLSNIGKQAGGWLKKTQEEKSESEC